MVDYTVQSIVILTVGGVLIWLGSFLAKFQRLYHDHHDYANTIASGSRDPKTKLHEIQQSRSLGRWRAAAIATAILVIILLCLSK
jgi:hypothetical protein